MAKMKIVIKSDGTSAGTTMTVNGSDITKTMNLTAINFSAYDDGAVYASWRALEKDEAGVEKSTSYTFNSPKAVQQSVQVVKTTPKVFIGKDAELQFETEQDKASHLVGGKLKQLKDVCEVKEIKDEQK